MNRYSISFDSRSGCMLAVMFAVAMGAGADEAPYVLLDDFRAERSAIGTEWSGFSDQVMGGVSQLSVVRVPDATDPYLRMSGKVSLENRGGFIQVRLMLAGSLRGFDASSFDGLRVIVRGEGPGYYIFLRTTSMIFPWKYFAAPVPVSPEWTTVDIPWTSFVPGDYGRSGRLSVGRLRSLALVAYGREFDARIDLKEIGLYRVTTNRN